MLPVTGCGVVGWPMPTDTAGDEQQLHVQGGHVLFAGQAAQAQAQPPPEVPVPVPASAGELMCMHEPDGHGVVKQAIPS